MQFNDYYEFTIAGAYLSALINGDYSGLTDTEEKEFDNWLSALPEVSGVFDVIEDESAFRECDICGLYADTYKVQLHFYNSEVTS